MEFDFVIKYDTKTKSRRNLGTVRKTYKDAIQDAFYFMYVYGEPWEDGEQAGVYLVVPVLNEEILVIGYRHGILGGYD